MTLKDIKEGLAEFGLSPAEIASMVYGDPVDPASLLSLLQRVRAEAEPLREAATAFIVAYDATYAADTAERFDHERAKRLNDEEDRAASALRAVLVPTTPLPKES